MKRKTPSTVLTEDKINSLNSIFNTAMDIIDTPELPECTQKDKVIIDDNQIIENLNTSEPLDDEDIISLKELKEDYKYIKDQIKENVKIGKEILNKIQQNEAASDFELLNSVSSLIKILNTSMKDLSRIFKDIKEIEKLRKERKIQAVQSTDSETTINNTQVNNNIIVKSLDDILSKF